MSVSFLADRIERECPNRRYVFERHPRKKLKLPLTDIKEVSAANRTDCEDRYLRRLKIIACRKRNSILILYLDASTNSVSSVDQQHMTLP